MKKLLLILFLLSFAFSFGQQNLNVNTATTKNDPIETILTLAAYPNPLSIKTKINFTSTIEQVVEFSVKNILGKTVYLEKIEAQPGSNSILFNRNNLPQGMYIYSVQTENEIVSKRLIIK